MGNLNVMTAEQVAATKAALMDQRPDSSISGESPLHHAELAKLAQSGPQTGGVVLRELALQGHLTLRCNAADPDRLAEFEAVMGVALPTRPLTSVVHGESVVRWISPDEWLISVPGPETFAIESRFRDQMAGHYSLVNGSGGMTVLQLSGERVVDLLKKSVPVDLHPSAFPVGKVVSTVFAKSSAIVRRVADKEFELVIRRSFADYLWLWIQDASREYGLVVKA